MLKSKLFVILALIAASSAWAELPSGFACPADSKLEAEACAMILHSLDQDVTIAPKGKGAFYGFAVIPKEFNGNVAVSITVDFNPVNCGRLMFSVLAAVFVIEEFDSDSQESINAFMGQIVEATEEWQAVKEEEAEGLCRSGGKTYAGGHNG